MQNSGKCLTLHMQGHWAEHVCFSKVNIYLYSIAVSCQQNTKIVLLQSSQWYTFYRRATEFFGRVRELSLSVCQRQNRQTDREDTKKVPAENEQRTPQSSNKTHLLLPGVWGSTPAGDWGLAPSNPATTVLLYSKPPPEGVTKATHAS